MSTDTRSQNCLHSGGHTCHLYADITEQKELLFKFLRRGIDAGEHCLYIAGDHPDDDWYCELRANGIDARNERNGGALQIIHRDEWRTADDFRSIVQARRMMGMIERYTGESKNLRIAFDGAWALWPALPDGELCHWEAASNLLYEGESVRVLCQYGLREHSGATIFTALRTHPFVVIEGVRRANPHYEAPIILEYEPLLNESSIDDARLRGMLDRLRSGR